MQNFIIGAGVWGLTLARLLAEQLRQEVVLVERRQHIGGNSYSYFDSETGIECHKYGSHIFHTSNPEVWKFVSRFADFTNYRHKVLAKHNGNVYAMPINLFSINALYGENFTPAQAREFIKQEAEKCGIKEPANLEEKALSQIGAPLYDAFIRDYTAKQWNHDPRELPASIINRLPVRFSYDINYFSDPWQGVPQDGYTKLFANMVDHPNIRIIFECEYEAIKSSIPENARVIYTGLPDALFGYKYGALEWRSLKFEWQTVDQSDFQGTAVMNYTDANYTFTRIHEFKHYNPERKKIFDSGRSVICREYPANWHKGDDAYYPVLSAANLALYERYKDEAEKEGIILGGRLGRYKYLDMDKAIADAMTVFKEKIALE